MTISALILKNLKKCKKLFILFCIIFLLSSIILSLETWLISRLVGCFEIADKTAALHHCFVLLQILVLYYLIRALSNGYYVTYLREVLFQTITSNIILDLFTNAHTHSVRYFDDEMSGRVSTAINNFANGLVGISFQILFQLIRPLCSLVVAFVIIATFSPLLSLSLFILNFPYFFAVYKVNKRFFNLSADSTKSENNTTGILVDSIANANLVKYSGSFFTEQLYFYKHLKKLLRNIIKQKRYQIFSRFAFHAVDTIFLTIGIILTLLFARYDNIALDDLFYVYTTIFGMVLTIALLNNFFQHFSENLGSLKAHYAVLNQPSEITEKKDALALHTDKIAVSFRNVGFSYIKGHPVFKNLNLNIRPNEKIGIVGHSGSGKSTLINLLLRYYDVTAGKILLNQTDIRDLAFNSLHRNIAVVSQDTSLFNRSIMENLRIAAPHATKTEIINAAKRAHIHDTIINLPDGYDSIVGEKGVKLSGGERQRIAIARAILQNAPVLILDEATSALDSESEILIEKALARLIKGKTVIAVAHRLSTLKNMDRIIVLDNGKIIEDGSPAELLQKPDSAFYHLYKLQSDGFINYGEK